MKYVDEYLGLRGIMAIWVVLGHRGTSIPLSLSPLPQSLYNDRAVEVFMFLSGFAICTLINDKRERYVAYVARRALRLFPACILFFLPRSCCSMAEQAFSGSSGSGTKARLQIIADARQYFVPHLLAHATLLHGIVPPAILPSTDTAFFGQAWSVTLECSFMFLLPC